MAATATTYPLTGNPSNVVMVKTKRKSSEIKPLISLISGGIAGGVEAATTYPFEFAKTRVQLKEQSLTAKNPFTVILHTVRATGFGSIYTGCAPLIFGTTFKAGVRFLSFDSIKGLLSSTDGHLSASNGIVAGMAAGAVESIVAVTPTERIKTALIDDARGPRRFKGGLNAARIIFMENGLFGIYRGLLATTLKQSATSAVRMGSYNMLRETAKHHQMPMTSTTTFAMGAIAGVITVYATQPFDTIKTRSQSTQGIGMGAAFRDVLKTTGIKGLWSGSTMRLGRLVLSGGIVFTVYEKLTEILSGFH